MMKKLSKSWLFTMQMETVELTKKSLLNFSESKKAPKLKKKEVEVKCPAQIPHRELDLMMCQSITD